MKFLVRILAASFILICVMTYFGTMYLFQPSVEIGTRIQISPKFKIQNSTSKILEECPENPPNLIGQKTPILRYPANWNTLEAKYRKVNLLGGQNFPQDCKARYKVAIIVPYRNRDEHLRYFVDHFHPFLQRQQLHYGIYVVEQLGDAPFNKG